jgi:hypothetical protein
MLKIVILLALLLFGAASSCMQRITAAQSFAWNFIFDGDQAKLAYGRPNSDEVGLMLTCKPNSGAITLAGDVTAENPKFTLVSGNTTRSFTGPAGPDPMTGGTWMEASASVQDAALASFAKTGKLTLVRDTGTLKMAATGADRHMVDRFFATCA